MLRVAPFARRSSSTAWTSLGTTQATRHSQRRCCATNHHHHSAATTLINGSSRHTTSLSHPDVDQVLQYDSMSAAQLRVALAAKDAIIHQLQQRVVALEKQTQHQKQPHVNGVNQPGPSTSPAVEANGHHSHGSLCCEATVSSEEELQHALSHGKLAIRIAAGATVTLTDAVYVEGELSLTGDPGATIVGQLRIKGASASLAATNVHFISPRADDSCIHVSQHGHLALVNCTVSNARDGIYLCGQAVATLDRTRIANCARGLFESHRCRAELLNAEFIDNLFHAVLLSHTDADAVKQLARAGNKFSGGRADVALGYNPMTDTYSQLYHAHSGAEIVLPADEATTNLVDPTW